MSGLPIPTRALAIGAHPDDIEFECGATLAKWAASGCDVSLVICTDGSKGTWDPDADAEELIATRQREQRAAAKTLGVTGEVVFLGWVDGEVEPSRAAQDQVSWWIRTLRPEVVLTHDPWKRYRLHPDHRNVGWVALDAIVAARDPHFFREHDVAHHRPSTLLLFEADEPDHVEDVTGFDDTKISALEEHRSQFESTMAITVDDDGSERERFRQRLLDEMRAAGEPHGFAAAEVYKLLDDL